MRGILSDRWIEVGFQINEQKRVLVTFQIYTYALLDEGLTVPNISWCYIFV
jgi:hypothetical protein